MAHDDEYNPWRTWPASDGAYWRVTGDRRPDGSCGTELCIVRGRYYFVAGDSRAFEITRGKWQRLPSAAYVPEPRTREQTEAAEKKLKVN